jgi:hypothetical protein
MKRPNLRVAGFDLSSRYYLKPSKIDISENPRVSRALSKGKDLGPTGRHFHSKQRPEHSKARCEDQCDGKHYIEKLIPPARWKITTKQQPKGFRMIVEDHDMSDRFFAFGDGSRRNHEDSLLFQRCGVRKSVGSSDHHSFLKRPKIDISQNFEELLNRGYW